MKTILRFLARPILLFYALPWLMVMLVLGTVAQRYIGLYSSEKIFFGSFILWVGVIPLPGAYSTLGIIALGLAAKLLVASPLKKRSAGTIITHISVLVLLAGGLVTSLWREEGYMVLGDNEISHTVSDYHERELAVVKNDTTVYTLPFSDWHEGLILNSPALPFTLRIEHYCTNCKVEKNAIIRIPPESEDVLNKAGIMFSVGTTHYVTLQGVNQPPEITLGNDKYHVIIRQAERFIPFAVRLIKFEKSEHPGTSIARSYRSEVEVTDGALQWKSVIEMNEPLRYRGYTLYQSSFVENGDTLFTVLAVVKNSGALFPYIAITSLCLGLAIHLVTRFAYRKHL